MTEKITEIRSLIGRSSLKKAIEELLKLNTDYNDMIVGVQGQLSELDNKKIIGIITNQDANLERNGISFSLLKIVSLIEKHTSEDSEDISVSDNEGLEKIINRNGLKRIDWLIKGTQKAKSVCKIHTGDGHVGTGFLIEGNYLYTNNHVINSASIAQYSRIEFGYENSENKSVFYNLDHTKFITSKKLDYTKVKVIDNDNFPLKEWGYLEINSTKPNPNDALVIIQHPQGRSKEIAFSDTENSIWEHRLHYKVTTEPGSSGSPVFDINWNVVALHHAGGNLPINNQGNVKYVNEGILFEYILADVAKNELNTKPDTESNRAIAVKKYNAPIKAVTVYNVLDNFYVEEITSHLFPQVRNGNIDIFDIQKAPPQEKKESFINEKINEADLIFIFISNNLYKKDTREIALQVEELVGTKTVIPIKISSFQLEGTPFGSLVGLPRQQSIKEYQNTDTVFYEIAQEISQVTESLING